jgi:purine catabolism regulator
MAPTLSTVVGTPGLALRVLEGAGRLDREVHWVAVSEQEDPTPYLEGGELLLTTGMRLDAAGEWAPAYVARLVARGVAGLGFGTGLGHERVPEALRDAARAAGLPLIEVPEPTPFVAVGKAVSKIIAAERHEALARTASAQRALTRAALRPDGPRAVITRLSSEIRGWALLLDATGEPRYAAPAEAAARAPGLGTEVERLRRLLRDRSGASTSVSGTDGHVVIQPLGDARRVSGFLAVGTRDPLPAYGNTVVAAAASLLSLELERPPDGRGLRSALLRLLMSGTGAASGGGVPVEDARDVLPAEPVRVAVAAGEPAGVLDELEAATRARVALTDARVLVAEVGGRATVLMPDAEWIVDAVAAGAGGTIGLSRAVPLDRLGEAYEQAVQALAAPVGKAGSGVVRRHEAIADGGLVGLLDSDVARGFAAATLRPLLEYESRADLIGSLRAFIAHGGHWDAAAESLGVHRHTLRYRMRRISDLLARDLSDPDTRAELWIALRIQDQPHPE